VPRTTVSVAGQSQLAATPTAIAITSIGPRVQSARTTGDALATGTIATGSRGGPARPENTELVLPSPCAAPIEALIWVEGG
jgi:hypothetical protein